MRPRVYREAEMVVKVKEILPPEYDLLRDGQILFTYIHSAIRPKMTQVLLTATSWASLTRTSGPTTGDSPCWIR